MNKEEFIKLFNATRKANKGKWYAISETINNNITIRLKGYNTWIQRIEIVSPTNTIIDSSVSDLSVKALNEWLSGTIDYIINKND